MRTSEMIAKHLAKTPGTDKGTCVICGLETTEAIFPEFPKLIRKAGAFRPPYWYPEYQEQIIIPEICNDNGM